MTQGIREGAERARKIVRDLRVFARSQDDVWQPVDLHEESSRASPCSITSSRTA